MCRSAKLIANTHPRTMNSTKEEYEFEASDIPQVHTAMLIDILAHQRILIDALIEKVPGITAKRTNEMLAEHRSEILRALYAQYGKTPL